MRYMFLIYTQEDAVARASEQEMRNIFERHRTVMAEAGNLGILQGAEPLATTATATTVRIENGKVLTTDGPFAETKEQLAGYYILECKDLDEAIAWAARIPTECGGASGCVEIRPMRWATANGGQ
jgi:hypothetical protein